MKVYIISAGDHPTELSPPLYATCDSNLAATIFQACLDHAKAIPDSPFIKGSYTEWSETGPLGEGTASEFYFLTELELK